MEIPELRSALTEEDEAILSRLGNAGYTVVVKYTRQGPEQLYSTYPAEWKRIYDENRYQWCDPAVLGCVFIPGDRRWSSIKVPPDFRGVGKRGAFYGLKYGATFTRLVDMQISLLAIARNDRELNEEEMLEGSSWFTQFVRGCEENGELRPILVEALSYQKNGLTIKESAAEACCTESAFKARLLGARKALNAKTTTEAVAIAIAKKLI